MKPKQFLQTAWGKSSLLLFVFSMLVICVIAQVTISGGVADETGKVVANITVLVRGTTQGSATDAGDN